MPRILSYALMFALSALAYWMLHNAQEWVRCIGAGLTGALGLRMPVPVSRKSDKA